MEKEHVRITKFLKAIMIATGCWRLKFTKNKFIQILYNIYSVIFQFSFLCTFLLFTIKLPLLLKMQDFESAIENIGYNILVLLVIIKMVISQTRRIRNLITQCILEEIRTYNEEPEIIQKNLIKNVKVLNRANSVPLLMSFFIISTYWYAKYMEYAKYKDINIPEEKPLPIPIWCPFNTNKYYEITYLIAACCNVLAVTSNTATQVLLYTLMTYVALQIKALKIRAMYFHLFDTTLENNKEKSILVILRDICIKHQSIISFVDELNAALKNVLLLEFLLNSLNIASVMLQIIILPHTTMIVFLVTYIILQVSQLFLMSWHANEIVVESISLADALFQSKWYDQSEKAKKCIYIIMLRSKKPLSLFIGPFYPMTNSTALSTLKVAYSYITMICALATKE